MNTMKSKPALLITICHHLFPMEITLIISTSRRTGLRGAIRSVALFAAEDGLKVSGLTRRQTAVGKNLRESSVIFGIRLVNIYEYSKYL